MKSYFNDLSRTMTLTSIENDVTATENSALDEIKTSIKTSNRAILDQITFDNYNYYLGFDKLSESKVEHPVALTLW